MNRLIKALSNWKLWAFVAFVILVYFLSNSKSCQAQGDLFWDPTAQDGADWEGSRMSTLKNGQPFIVDGLPAVRTTVDLVCGGGNVTLNTVGLVHDPNSTYWITPAICTIQLKDATGVVISTQVLDQYHIHDSSQRNYSDPLRVADTICWLGLVDNNIAPILGSEPQPRMSEGWGNSFTGLNEAIPAYLPLLAPLPSGEYEYCITGDFSYFLDESTDPNEIPDSWCKYYSYDATTGLFTNIPYPTPPAPVQDIDVAYTPGEPVDVVIDGDPNAEYEVERWTRKGGNENNNKSGGHKRLNGIIVQGNQFSDPDIENDATLFWNGNKDKVHFYYKARVNGSAEWKQSDFIQLQ